MSQDWMPGAERISGAQVGGSMLGGPAKVTHHITTGGSYSFLKGYLIQMRYEPTLLIDPVNNLRGQFLSAAHSAYAMKHTTAPTNTQGVRHIQIEWCWDSMTHPTIDKTPHWKECWADVLAFARANGVPDVLPFGTFTNPSRDVTTWQKGGHAGHLNAPGNDHSDSLPVSTLAGLFGPAPAPVHHGDRWLGLADPPMHDEPGNPDVSNVQRALNLLPGNNLQVDGVYGRTTADTIQVFQEHRGINERGVGPQTWTALRAIPGVHG